MRRGFTLLELIAVIGLIAILGGLVAWRATAWLPEARLDAAARQIVVDLRLTRGRAMAEHRQRRMLFVADEDLYRRQRRNGASYEDDASPVSLPAGIDLVGCSAAGAAIAFAPRGTAATFGTVTLRNTGGRERRVIVDMVGRVRVQ